MRMGTEVAIRRALLTVVEAPSDTASGQTGAGLGSLQGENAAEDHARVREGRRSVQLAGHNASIRDKWAGTLRTIVTRARL